jgi:threonine synthase
MSWPEHFSITNDTLDLDALVGAITIPETGAVAVFSGAVRGKTRKEGAPEETSYLFYEAYEPMAEKTLRQVAAEIRERWPKVQGISIVQRIGRLEVGEITILVACSSGHRNDGIFEAAHYGINRVKEIVPVWKKEVGPDGSLWVEGEYHPTPADVPPPNGTECETSSMLLSCPDCGEQYPIDTTNYVCNCGKPLALINVPNFDRGKIRASDSSMWRYQVALGATEVEPVTLGEGWTPLVSVDCNDFTVYVKLESLNPTGSFKDRGASLLTSFLRSAGIELIHDDSSGNAGAALAAYAARAGMAARLYIPDRASPVKLAQIELYGAEVIPVSGPRSGAQQAAQRATAHGESYYASHIYHPIAILGYETIAFEIWEQLGQRAPDVVLVPIGHGSQILGIAGGFRRLMQAGLIAQLPRLIGVQAEACAPIWSEFHAAAGPQQHDTIAEGIQVTEPVRSAEVIKAIKDTEGDIMTVSEEAIHTGFYELAVKGLLVELTSAVVWPALKTLGQSVEKNATIVLSISGSGLKTPQLDHLARYMKQESRKP